MLELLLNDQVVSFVLSVVLLIVTFLFRARVRIVWTISHGFLHHLKGRDFGSRQSPTKGKKPIVPNDMLVWVRTLMIMNRGRAAAENVEITLNWKPLGLSVLPQRAYSEIQNPDGRYVLLLPGLASHETVSVHMLDVKDLPNVTSIRSRIVVGKLVESMPTILYPKWVLFVLWCMVIIGVLTAATIVIYLLISFVRILVLLH